MVNVLEDVEQKAIKEWWFGVVPNEIKNQKAVHLNTLQKLEGETTVQDVHKQSVYQFVSYCLVLKNEEHVIRCHLL